MSKYRTSWSQIQEQMNEFALSHTVRYRDPLNKKRFAVPFKTAEKAKAKMDQLKRDGVKEIEITKDILRGKFKEGVIPNTQSAKNKLYKDYIKQGKHPDAAAELVGNAVAEGTIVEDGHEDVSSSKRMAQVIGEDAQLILQELNKKSDEETLPTWWTNKLATSAHNMNAARDYISNDIKESSDGYTVKFANSKGAKIASAWYKDEESAKKALEAIRKNGGNGIISKGKMNEELEEGYRTVGNEKGTEWKVFKDGKLIKTFSTYIQAHDYVKQQKEDLEESMSDAQLKKVRDSYKDLKTISPEKVKTLRNFLDRYSTDSLMQLAQANINFVSTMARSVMNKRKMGDPKHAGSMKEEVKTDSQKIADLRVRQMMLQTKVRDMNPTKDKTDIEIAKNKLDNIELRMDKIKSKNEEVELQEKIEGLANKSEKSGVPYGILKKVYDRGMAAWKGGHRPGTTPQQWAFARVNSFLTGGKTRTTADADLWQKAKAAKSKK